MIGKIVKIELNFNNFAVFKRPMGICIFYSKNGSLEMCLSSSMRVFTCEIGLIDKLSSPGYIRARASKIMLYTRERERETGRLGFT